MRFIFISLSLAETAFEDIDGWGQYGTRKIAIQCPRHYGGCAQKGCPRGAKFPHYPATRGRHP